MPIVKKYVTWKAKKINDSYYQHPNTDGRANSESNGDINFIETPYESIDGTYISIAEHEWNLPQARLNALMIKDPDFQFVSVTEEEVNVILLEAYWLDWESNPYVSVSNHEFTDNRPTDV